MTSHLHSNEMNSTRQAPLLGAGVGLKPEYYRDVMAASDPELWVEVHPENYMTDGGPRLAWLSAIRDRRPLSLHGVGMSLASDEPIDPTHVARWRSLVDRFEPELISEHVAWSKKDGVYFADLLPTPATRQAADQLADNIDRMQDALGRTILIENPSLYVDLKGDMSEPEFLVEVCGRTGCGLLLDVNNVFVTANNIGRDARDYIEAIPGSLIGEVHLAGHRPDSVLGDALLIDSHDEAVNEEVWALYDGLIKRVGPKPTLIERDSNLPTFAELVSEVRRAQTILHQVPLMGTAHGQV